MMMAPNFGPPGAMGGGMGMGGAPGGAAGGMGSLPPYLLAMLMGHGAPGAAGVSAPPPGMPAPPPPSSSAPQPGMIPPVNVPQPPQVAPPAATAAATAAGTAPGAAGPQGLLRLLGGSPANIGAILNNPSLQGLLPQLMQTLGMGGIGPGHIPF